MKIKKVVHVILDEEKNEEGMVDGKLILDFTGATIKQVLQFSKAAAVFRDRFEAKLLPKAAGTGNKRELNKWGIPITAAEDKKAYMKAWHMCKTLGLKYAEALPVWQKREQERAAKRGKKQQDPPADPPQPPAGSGGPAPAPAGSPPPVKKPPVKRPAAAKPPEKKTPREPRKPGKKEPVKSAFGFTIGDKVKQISGPEALPGVGEITGFSDKPEHTRNIQVKFINHVRWLGAGQIEVVKKAEP